VKAEHFSADVLDFLRLLKKHEVRYLLVGGTAVIYHGYARMTGDVDFFFERSESNVDRIWRALSDFWGGDVPSLRSARELMDPNLVLQYGRPPNRIDLIGSLSFPFEDAWAARVEESLEVDGERIPIFILGLEHLRKAKRAAGRPKDLDDLAHLG
jgi:hypothetical protein